MLKHAHSSKRKKKKKKQKNKNNAAAYLYSCQAIFEPPPENWRRPPGWAAHNLDEEHS